MLAILSLRRLAWLIRSDCVDFSSGSSSGLDFGNQDCILLLFGDGLEDTFLVAFSVQQSDFKMAAPTQVACESTPRVPLRRILLGLLHVVG